MVYICVLISKFLFICHRVDHFDFGDCMNEREIQAFMKKLSTLMYISFAIWIVIVIMQFFIGIITVFFGYGIGTLILMVYNLVGCIRYFKNIEIIKNYSTKVEAGYCVTYFEKSIPMCWIFMFVNLVLGGFIGFVGNLYDLIIAYYVKGKKGELLMPVSDPIIYDVQ